LNSKANEGPEDGDAHPEPNVLTKESIIHRLDERSIVIDPLLEDKQIGSVSIDLRLDNEFGEFQSTRKPMIDPADLVLDYVKISEIDFYSEPYALQAGHFVLGKTFEYVSLPNDIVGLLEGRSSVGRQGLMVHVTAGVVDPGFSGHLVFELANVGKMPILLYPLMRIARITFLKTHSTDEYRGKFAIQLRIKIPTVDPDLRKIRKMSKSKNTMSS
jgi:dCTP deaminase